MRCLHRLATIDSIASVSMIAKNGPGWQCAAANFILRETNIFSSQTRGIPGIANGLLAVFCLFAFGYLFFSPSLATPAYPQDTFFILADGWRFANGQIPYMDYYSPLGPLSGVLTGLGMLMSRAGSGLAHSVLIGQGIMLVALLPVSVFVAYRRLRGVLGAVFCFIIASLLASRVTLGDLATSHLTVTGTYNSQGYALLLLFGLMVLLPPQTETRRTQIAESILGGVLLLMTFFDKLNYFGAAVAILVVAVFTPPLLPAEKRLGLPVRDALQYCASFVVIGALILIVFGISPLRIIGDIARLLHAQATFVTTPTRGERLPKILLDVFRQYAVVLFGFPLMLRFIYGRLAARHEMVLVALSVFLLVLSIVVMLGNLLQDADLFLILLLTFIWVEAFARDGAPATALGSALVSAILVLTVLQHQTVAVLSTVRAAAVEFRSGKTPNRWLAGTGLSDLVIPNNEGAVDLLSSPPPGWSFLPSVRQIDALSGGDLSMYELSQMVSEGQCLLIRNSSPQDRIFTDWTYDIFSLLRPQAPPRGGSLGNGPAFDAHLSPDQVRAILADATLIISPKGNLLSAIFIPTEPALIARDFTKVGDSRYWSLWRRKGTGHAPQGPACPSVSSAPA